MPEAGLRQKVLLSELLEGGALEAPEVMLQLLWGAAQELELGLCLSRVPSVVLRVGPAGTTVLPAFLVLVAGSLGGDGVAFVQEPFGQ